MIHKKIYVLPAESDENSVFNYWTDMELRDSVTFIRKDALIKLVGEMKAGVACLSEDSVYWGMGEAYQRVIDMLNEF